MKATARVRKPMPKKETKEPPKKPTAKPVLVPEKPKKIAAEIEPKEPVYDPDEEQDEEETEDLPIAEEVVDPDPMPVAPVFSGKDEDFPAWRQADMYHKEKFGQWMARRQKA